MIVNLKLEITHEYKDWPNLCFSNDPLSACKKINWKSV